MLKQDDNLHHAKIEMIRAKAANQPVCCRDLDCQSREDCPHSRPHAPNDECHRVCGADEPFSRCFPFEEVTA